MADLSNQISDVSVRIDKKQKQLDDLKKQAKLAENYIKCLDR